MEDLHTNGRITLKYILMKWDGKALTGLIWLRRGASDGFFVNSVMKLWVP